jgi:rhodanese-related sulfurtransferase
MKFLIIFFLIFNSLFQNYSYCNEVFPLRNEYKNLKYIGKKDLYSNINNFVVVDVRSNFEYDTIHINDSINIDFSNAGFLSSLQEFKNIEKKIILYCNGFLCKKSYEAGKTAEENGFKNILVYDEGIYSWATSYPNKTTLLSKTPAELKFLPNENEIEKRSLSILEFKEKIKNSKNPLVIDVREVKFRNNKLNLKDIRNIKIKNLISSLEEGKFGENSIFIFDSVGKQIEWIYIYIKKYSKEKDTWFLKGGIDSLKQNDLK